MANERPLKNVFEGIKTSLRTIIHDESHIKRIAMGMELTNSLTELEDVLTEIIVTMNNQYNLGLFQDDGKN